VFLGLASANPASDLILTKSGTNGGQIKNVSILLCYGSDSEEKMNYHGFLL